MEKKGLQQDLKTRNKLRKFGFILTGIGAICLIISLVDFFSSMNSFDSPKLFWLGFVGMPFLFIGFVFLGYGYMGSVSRYAASEVAPVTKDTFNYLAEGTKESIAGVVKEIKATNKIVHCPNCKAENDHDAIFCKSCGTSLVVVCKSCGTKNDADAMFCDKCGKPIK